MYAVCFLEFFESCVCILHLYNSCVFIILDFEKKIKNFLNLSGVD